MEQRSAQSLPEEFKVGEIHDVIIRKLHKIVDERGWLAELFRQDELQEKEFHPVMAYISSTEPGVTRGPHEHAEQADFFCFIGPSNFELHMWDNRKDSETYNYFMKVKVGQDNPTAVLVPKGVVHAYRNVGELPGLVINCPNRLYKGEGRRQDIDEIRHEDEPETRFRMDE
jgi:dTDP-4-dehydrorhamnose 3,5-epimerase